MAKLLHLVCLLVVATLACSATAAKSNSKYDNRGRYNPYYNDPYYNSRYYKNRDYYNNRQYYDNFFKQYNPEVAAPQARIVEQTNDANTDGRYAYRYETENGIHGEEHGVPVKVGTEQQAERVEGSYSFITPEGVRVGVRYTADENGYHPIITYDGVGAERYANLQQAADVVLTRIN